MSYFEDNKASLNFGRCSDWYNQSLSVTGRKVEPDIDIISLPTSGQTKQDTTLQRYSIRTELDTFRDLSHETLK